MVKDRLPVLFYKPSYTLIAPLLEKEFPQLDAFTMDNDGAIYHHGKQIDSTQADPEIAWASHRLTVSPILMRFLDWVTQSKTVRWIQTPSAGTDNPIFAKLIAQGIQVTRSDEAGVGIAEFIMARVMEAFHNPHRLAALQANRDWQKIDFREISGTTWLVLGFGNIGTSVGRRARAFGARVIGVRRNANPSDAADLVITPDEVKTYLNQADVVVSTLPGSSETEGLINESFLKLMKKDSVFVNIGRGSVVDEEALLRALDRDTPAFAALDVFRTEPLPPESPFWRHPKVRVSAHFSIGLEGAAKRGQDMFIRNLRRYIAKQPLELLVDAKLLDRK